jgi:hypothetical protein
LEAVEMNHNANYFCDSCGEEIAVPSSRLSAGSEREYVEDCPVCCTPNVIHVEVDEDGDVRVWAARENSKDGADARRRVNVPETHLKMAGAWTTFFFDIGDNHELP